MKPVITDIPGIGPAAAAALGEHHISSLAKLASASVETISAIPGFSETRAIQTITAAAELLAVSGVTQSAEDKAKGKKDKKEKKKKDKGKGKKGKGKKGKEKKKGKK